MECAMSDPKPLEFPVHQAALFDPEVKSLLKDIEEGRVVPGNYECQGPWSKEDVARLDAVLTEIFCKPEE
jgi:hypothetical protein